jgi:hypothetical protein
MSKNLTQKPLKGTSINSNLGVFDTLQANNIILSAESIDGLMNGAQLIGVTIVDSEIQNTIIGANGPNEGYFTTLKTTSDIIFASLNGYSMVWDANNGIFKIVGSLNLEGCATIGNILICDNDIKALNTNGDINIISKGFGGIYLNGPVTNNVLSSGNYLTSLADGNVTFIASDYINMISQSSGSLINTFSDQVFSTVNGDITLNTESGYGQKLISNIFSSGGNVNVTTLQSSNLRIGDEINLTNTNSIPILNGDYIVKSVINSNTFTISTANTFTGISTNGTTGILLKPLTNNINLNASVYVKIQDDIKLTFGSTENSISGNTSGLIFNSLGGNAVFNVPGAGYLQIPQDTKLQFGTSGSNYINFDGNNFNINTVGDIQNNGQSEYINTTNLFIKDPIPMISNYTQSNTDLSDKGIQFNYWSGGTGGSSKLGWFGYKQSTGKFTLLTSATNSNEVITGIAGKFDIGDISTTSITINPGSFIDVNCGNLLNVNRITGCAGTININSSNNVNITTGTRLALISGGDIFIPNNIPLTLGSNGSYIKDGTGGNLWLNGSKNIMLNTQTNGSVILQPNVKLSFDGSSVGNQSMSGDTNGDLNINTNKNINLTTTSGNIIIPRNTSGNSNGFPSIQFGSSSVSETISGNTRGIFIHSTSSQGTLNLISNSNVNIYSSIGNINVSTLTGDVQLFTTNGNTRMYQGSYLVFGISGTSNSVRSNSSGNLVINGPGIIPTSGTIGNLIELKNTSVINLSANKTINVPTSVPINLDSGLGNRYIIADTNANLLITNSNTNASTIITSLNTTINNTGGITSIINNTTNISSNTLTISGTNTFINTANVKIQDPILSLANYNLSSNDLKDRGIEYNYYSTSGSMKLGWFGYKNNTGQFTYYSEAINTGEVITGTLGQFALGSVVVSNDITFVNAGNINMNCGTISNLNTIMGCNGTINVLANQNLNISSSNIFLTSNTAGKVLIPNNVPLSFGNTSNSISSDSNGNMSINVNSGSGTLILNSNVQINGTTNNVFSTVTNIQDPIFSIGGVTGPSLDDLKDRGIEFKWYGTRDGTTGSKVGFFGFDNSTQRFTYLPASSNTNEIISGKLGDVEFSNGYYSNLDVKCGTVANVSVLTACAGQGLSIISSSGNINISSSNIILPNDTKLAFGSTSNSISSTTSGNLNINSIENTTITSNSGGIIFNTNTSGSGFTQFSENSPMYFGSQSSGNFLLRDTSGNFNITNTSGDIYISPYTNNTSNSYGNVILPTNNNLVFGNSTTRITSDGTNLQLYGYSIGINSTTTITFNGNVNIVGSVSSVDSGKYIYPLGTRQQLGITSIVNSTTSGNILVTTDAIHYLIVGDQVTLTNTDSTPVSNATYTVNQIINSNTFSVSNTTLSSPGTTGIMYGVLKVYQGKDVGIEVDYWSTVGNTSVTAGSANYKQAFFGWLNSTQQWTYYSNATIQNDIVTQGVLGDIRVNQVYTNKISGFTLDGPVVGGTFTIAGSNFQISGGGINSTPIGQTSAQTGRFTSLSSTVSTSLENVTMQSNLNYSVERYTLSSLLPTRSPSTSVITSYINVSGVSFNCSGTIGNGLSDGQVKKLVCSSMGNNCEYRLAFPSGKLIAPNPLGGPLPTRITFRRQGMSIELIWDASLAAWIISGGNGAIIGNNF